MIGIRNMASVESQHQQPSVNNVQPSVFTYHGQEDDRAPSNTTHAIIHTSVTTIHVCAFESCKDLINVVLHDNITLIDDYAFLGCQSLQVIKLPQNLEVIGEAAFSECCSLEVMFLPPSVKNIGESAFGQCSSLRFFHIPEREYEYEYENNYENAMARDHNDSHGMGYSLLFESYELFTNANVEYEWNADESELMNNDDVNHWLRTREDHLPLHKLAYSTEVSVERIEACIQKQKQYGQRQHRSSRCRDGDRAHTHTHTHVHVHACAQTNNQKMTPLHILMANPHAGPEVIAACYHAYPQAIAMADDYGCNPIHYLCKYKPNIIISLNQSQWLEGGISCRLFHQQDDDGISPLKIIMDADNTHLLPLTLALRINLRWEDGMREIVGNISLLGGNEEVNSEDSSRDRDRRTGLYLFLLAAVDADADADDAAVNEDTKGDGKGTTGTADLSTVYELLRANPDPVVVCVMTKCYGGSESHGTQPHGSSLVSSDVSTSSSSKGKKSWRGWRARKMRRRV